MKWKIVLLEKRSKIWIKIPRKTMGKTMVFFYIFIGNGFHSHSHFLFYHYHWVLLTIPIPMVSIPISISCFTITISCFFHPTPTISISIGNHSQRPISFNAPEKIFSLKFELSTTQFKINHTGVYFTHPPQNFTVLSTTQKGQNYGT